MEQDAERSGPLSGVRVLDLTRVVMGPFATQILADQGADVIMIEAADGDTNRVMGPGPHPELSGIALNLLRNKQSAVVDLKSDEGREFIRRTIEHCDVVVATMRPRSLRALGVDYDTLATINPGLVYCQAQGYPIGSGEEDRPAYDDTIQAATGVADLMGRVNGTTSLIPTIVADKVCGIVIAQAVSAALFERERTGHGQHIEVPMTQAMTSFMLAEHGSGEISRPAGEESVGAAGYPRVLSPDRRPHVTSDGIVHLFPYLPAHYRALFDYVDRLADIPQSLYATRRATLENSDALYRTVREVCATKTTQEWLDFCHETGIPVSPVRTLEALVGDLPTAVHPVAGEYRVLPAMANFGRHRSPDVTPAPLIGEQTATVLQRFAALDPSSAETS